MRILIADSDLRVRVALSILLAEQDETTVVAECADLEGLVRQIQEFEPHLVLLDWELPGQPAAAFLLGASHMAFRPKLIILSTRLETRALALAIGADGFALKADPPEALLAVYRKVAAEQLRGSAIDALLPLPPPTQP